jgi:hypothetical protein
MPAVQKNLYIEQGATFTLGFNWHQEGAPDADGNPTAGAAYDITGAIVRMQARKTQQSTVLIDASTTNGKITIDGPTGRIDVKLDDDTTDLLVYKSAIYDLEIELASGDVHRLLQGSITVSPNVTQETDDPIVDQP